MLELLRACATKLDFKASITVRQITHVEQSVGSCGAASERM